MSGVAIERNRLDAVGDDLGRSRQGVPQRHVLQDVLPVRKGGITMDDARVVLAVDVDGGGVGHDRVDLERGLERGVDVPPRRGQPDQVRPGALVATSRDGEWGEEVAVDGHLRVGVVQIIQSALPDGFERWIRSRPTGGPEEVRREILALRRHLEADLGRVQIDEHDVHVDLSRRGRQRDGVGPLDERDAGVGMRDNLRGAEPRGQPTRGHGSGDDDETRSIGHDTSVR